MKKNVFFYSIIILGLFSACESSEIKTYNSGVNDALEMFEASINCQGRLFPSDSTPNLNSIIVFFNGKSCMSCVIDLKTYIETKNIGHKLNIAFYTNNENKNLEETKGIFPMLHQVLVSGSFANLKYPIIFETDSTGHIKNCMPVSTSCMYLCYQYVDMLSVSHSSINQKTN